MESKKMTSLSSSINETLKSLSLAKDFYTNLIDEKKNRIRNKNETVYWDYKETINLKDPFEIAKLAKRVLGISFK